ncbi:molybdenum cofactor guanylyltransferase [Deltaproteobacteria bacterium]|nr:molybdenum cofactor guanylyltransferase [Deltaproteobacteria bacterium]
MKSFIKGVTGVILAGGKSLRFGSNKALVEINGAPLIERVTHVLSSVFNRLILITNSPQEYSSLQLPIYEDIIKGLGPIGGIYTGLEAINDEKGFFVACDMPFINEDLIRYIAGVGYDFDVVVPKIDWRIEPLHALYSKSCLPIIKGLIASDIHQIIRSFQSLHVRYVDEAEIKSHDPLMKSFMNINRQDELLNAMNCSGKDD